MKKTANKNITTLDEILDKKYGKKGAPKREKWEQEFESFRLGVLLEEARIKMGLTQEELAARLGIPKIQILRWEKGMHAPGPTSISLLKNKGILEK